MKNFCVSTCYFGLLVIRRFDNFECQMFENFDMEFENLLKKGKEKGTGRKFCFSFVCIL